MPRDTNRAATARERGPCLLPVQFTLQRDLPRSQRTADGAEERIRGSQAGSAEVRMIERSLGLRTHLEVDALANSRALDHRHRPEVPARIARARQHRRERAIVARELLCGHQVEAGIGIEIPVDGPLRFWN